MSNVYRLRRRKYPADTKQCLTKLLEHPDLEGAAFVAYINGSGYIADACGKAKEEIEETRLMLRTLDAKLARLQK